jgi:prepilin-type N-terminal cleavage/methylation domain-containing protein
MKRKAFTIIELIVVLSVIALLVSALAPALNKIKEHARSLAQRAQFRNIEMGLEGWANDHDFDYPDSNSEITASGSVVGAQKLCEALLGRDLKGFDPKSSWNPWKDQNNPDIYSTTTKGRIEPYAEITKLQAFQFGQLWADTNPDSPYPGNCDDQGNVNSAYKPCYLLTDHFKRKSIRLPAGNSVRVGSPILYYKANDRFKALTTAAPASQSIFNFTDNAPLMQYGQLNDELKKHPFYAAYTASGSQSNPRLWVEALLAPSPAPTDQGGVLEGTPYNKDSFILLSAGPDGLYGTKDDIWNISGKK